MEDLQLDIWVNGEPRHVPRGATLGDLIGQLGLEPQRLAIAVNRAVVPRAVYAARELVPGDRVEILRAVGGG